MSQTKTLPTIVSLCPAICTRSVAQGLGSKYISFPSSLTTITCDLLRRTISIYPPTNPFNSSKEKSVPLDGSTFVWEPSVLITVDNIS